MGVRIDRILFFGGYFLSFVLPEPVRREGDEGNEDAEKDWETCGMVPSVGLSASSTGET
jgi:hypothetical protein